MDKVFVITRREFLKYVRSKWFRFFTILPLVGMGLIYLVSSMMPEGGFGAGLKEEKIKQIGVIDYSESLIYFLEDTEHYQFIEMDSIEAIDKTFAGDIDGFVIIPVDSDSLQAVYYSRSLKVNMGGLEDALGMAAFKGKLKEKGLDISLAEELKKGIEITPQKITEKGGKGGEELLALGIGMVIFLYMFIILASQLMARSAVEEKLNGVIEVIISDISPSRLLLGKFLGVTTAIILMILIWIIVGSTFMGNSLFFINKTIDISLPVGILLYFAAAFIFGYTLYASFVLMFVSTVNSEQEVNQAMSAGVILVLIPYFLTLFWIVEKPSSLVSVISSFIPFFTPLVMPMRLSISTVPLWEIILSIVLLAVAAWGTLFLAGKVYRVSMLMVGKPLRLKEVFLLMRKK
ncbi:ABC transporter permease [candidate division WOR-3 bacterium]|nr:ABC transporter permease [candidate division WOR-3 bacterium]